MSKMRWNPETGDAVVFADDETPPANFLPCHPDDPARDAKVALAALPAPKEPERDDADVSGGLTKAEIADALTAGGVEFDAAARKAVLADHLITALKRVLTGRGVAYEENETAKALLDKVTGAPQE